jgi:hypothetical protein
VISVAHSPVEKKIHRTTVKIYAMKTAGSVVFVVKYMLFVLNITAN